MATKEAHPLYQLQGTSEPFATALWTFWMGEGGPGRVNEKVLKCPLSINRKPVDMEALWNHVNQRGGFERVKAMKLWATVGRNFNPPPSCTNLSYIVRFIYSEVLLDLENKVRKGGSVPGISLPELVEDRPDIEDEESAPVQKGHFGSEIIGKIVRVWWPAYKKYYRGEIKEYDSELKSHLISYVDGEQNWIKLSDTKFSFVKPEKKRNLTDYLSSPYDVDDDRSSKRTYHVPLLTELQKKTGVMIKVSGKYSFPQHCGITQLVETSNPDGYEVFALLPGLNLEDITVTCSPDGRLAIDAAMNASHSGLEMGLKPIHQLVHLPTKLNVEKTVALLTLHGLLYVKLTSRMK